MKASLIQKIIKKLVFKKMLILKKKKSSIILNKNMSFRGKKKIFRNITKIMKYFKKKTKKNKKIYLKTLFLIQTMNIIINRNK